MVVRLPSPASRPCQLLVRPTVQGPRPYRLAFISHHAYAMHASGSSTHKDWTIPSRMQLDQSHSPSSHTQQLPPAQPMLQSSPLRCPCSSRMHVIQPRPTDTSHANVPHAHPTSPALVQLTRVQSAPSRMAFTSPNPAQLKHTTASISKHATPELMSTSPATSPSCRQPSQHASARTMLRTVRSSLASAS